MRKGNDMKPCPFCNGEGVLSQWAQSPQDVSNSWIPGESSACIRCKTCGASTRTVSISSGSHEPDAFDMQTATEEAVRLWETRQ